MDAMNNAAQKPVDGHIHLLGCDVAARHDEIASLLRAKEARWSFDREGQSTSLPLGELDECAWSLVAQAVRQRRSRAFAHPGSSRGLQ
mgnify:CR=1 FL=1